MKPPEITTAGQEANPMRQAIEGIFPKADESHSLPPAEEMPEPLAALTEPDSVVGLADKCAALEAKFPGEEEDDSNELDALQPEDRFAALEAKFPGEGTDEPISDDVADNLRKGAFEGVESREPEQDMEASLDQIEREFDDSFAEHVGGAIKNYYDGIQILIKQGRVHKSHGDPARNPDAQGVGPSGTPDAQTAPDKTHEDIQEESKRLEAKYRAQIKALKELFGELRKARTWQDITRTMDEVDNNVINQDIISTAMGEIAVALIESKFKTKVMGVEFGIAPIEIACDSIDIKLGVAPDDPPAAIIHITSELITKVVTMAAESLAKTHLGKKFGKEAGDEMAEYLKLIVDVGRMLEGNVG